MLTKFRWNDMVGPGDAFLVQTALMGRGIIGIHTHDFAEIVWVFTGRVRHCVNGKIQELEPGDLVFIRSDDSHFLENISPNPMGLVNIAFPVETARNLRRRYFAGTMRWFWKRGSLPELCRLEPARLARLQEWADYLLTAPNTRFEIDRFLMDLLHLVDVRVEQEPLPPEAPDWLATACRQIREGGNMREGVAAWVRLAGRSPEHVSRVTRQWLGVSPTDYVNRIRLAFMERQLRLTAHNILDLTLDAGFSNLGYAYKLFKRHYGLPPRQYRQKHRKLIV